MLTVNTAAKMLESSPIAFFWRNKPKSDLVKPTKDLLNKLRQLPRLQKVNDCDLTRSTPANTRSQTEEEVARLLAQMKLVLTGTQG